MARYALYFSPVSNPVWLQAGNLWLGRDIRDMREGQQLRVTDVAPKVLHTLTRDARRYGFHATLKAPFRLAEGYQRADLEQALQAFCASRSAITIPSPQVSRMGQFLALRPQGDESQINALAMHSVREFDHLRAPLRPEELAKRQQQQLSARQLRLLSHWGYPYTEEEFRFHLTLTDALDNTDSANAIYQAALRHFALTEPLRIDGISLCYESEAGAPFILLKQFPFAAD